MEPQLLEQDLRALEEQAPQSMVLELCNANEFY